MKTVLHRYGGRLLARCFGIEHPMAPTATVPLDANTSSALHADSYVWQKELHPSTPPAATTRLKHVISPDTRAFRKLVNIDALRPGDLLLTRHVAADGVSNAVAAIQSRLGFGVADARWSHGAMYIGRFQEVPYVIEADVKSYFLSGNVHLTPLEYYSRGDYVLRFRRPRNIADECAGLRLALCAMTRLRQPYALHVAAFVWFKAAMARYGEHNAHPYPRTLSRPIERAFICTSLYAWAYRMATRRHLDDYNGIVLPASLSLSDDFVDVATHWDAIA